MRDIDNYTEKYLGYNDFEKYQVIYRRRKILHQFPRFTQHNLSYLPADLGKLRMHQHFLAV